MSSLIILCASHLKNEQNVTQIIEMLDTQMQQTQICDIYVSYTGISLNYNNPRVHLIKQPEHHLTQFQHYVRLIRALWASHTIHSENHVIFTDDDDLMSPERNETYLKLIRPEIDIIVLVKGISRFSLDIDIIDRASSLQHALNKSGFDVNYLHPSEYVDNCVRGDVLHEIISQIDEEKSK